MAFWTDMGVRRRIDETRASGEVCAELVSVPKRLIYEPSFAVTGETLTGRRGLFSEMVSKGGFTHVRLHRFHDMVKCRGSVVKKPFESLKRYLYAARQSPVRRGFLCKASSVGTSNHRQQPTYVLPRARAQFPAL